MDADTTLAAGAAHVNAMGQKAPLDERLRVASALRLMPAAIVARRRASSARSHSANQVGGDASVGLSCGVRMNRSPRRVVVVRTVQSSPKLRLASSADLAIVAMYRQRYTPPTQAANFYLAPGIAASARLGTCSVDIRLQRGVQVRWPQTGMAIVAKKHG